MIWILGIDTFYHMVVGLARDGEPIVSKMVADTRVHGEALTPLIRQLCASAGTAVIGINTYAIGMGPGPFTELRVEVVAIRTLAVMAGRPLHGACPLGVIAAWWQDAPGGSMVVFDAYRKEFYWTFYHDGIRVGEPRMGAPGTIPDLSATSPIPGDPAGLHHLDTTVLVARQTDLLSVDGESFYLRVADVVVPKTRKSMLLRPRVPR